MWQPTSHGCAQATSGVGRLVWATSCTSYRASRWPTCCTARSCLRRYKKGVHRPCSPTSSLATPTAKPVTSNHRINNPRNSLSASKTKMKTAAFSAAAVLSLASTALGQYDQQSKPFELIVTSADKSINGDGLSSCHEGAGMHE